MYDDLRFDDRELAAMARGQDPALYDTGDARRLLRYHREHLNLWRFDSEIPDPRPLLLRRIADARTMHQALCDTLRNGGGSHGPNGRRLEYLDRSDRWALSRTLARALRLGTYRRGGERRLKVPKAGKPGRFREITIQNAEDRIVGRAATLILSPFFDPGFSPYSFGFRPGLGVEHALATAITIAESRGLWTWISADVANAFDVVPFQRFIQVLRQWQLPDDLIEFLKIVSYTGKSRGIPQGSSLSPLLFNMFADWVLDKPWLKRHFGRPLLRYADDLLVLCMSPQEAAVLYEELSRRCRSAGLPLKPEGPGFIDLSAGGSIQWLGYRISLGANGIEIHIADRAWNKLGDNLQEAYLHPAPPIRAAQTVQGWLQYIGPCVAFEDRQGVLDRVYTVAETLAFNELPPADELIEIMDDARSRWEDVQRRIAATVQYQLNPDAGGDGSAVEDDREEVAAVEL